MSTSRKVTLTTVNHIRQIHHQYTNSINYIAMIVTISLILQIWWMTRGRG